MNIQPLGDRVLVQRVQAQEKTPGGLYIPDGAKEKPTEAIVKAVGPGRVLDNGTRKSMEVSVGDKIVFGKYNGSELEFEGEKYMMLSEEDIMAVLC